jgi:hypothetical protein
LDKGQNISVDIYNILGVKVAAEQLNLSAGNHILIKNFDLQSGQYFVNIADVNGVSISIKKLVVIK